jgi:hypothetical protein
MSSLSIQIFGQRLEGFSFTIYGTKVPIPSTLFLLVATYDKYVLNHQAQSHHIFEIKISSNPFVFMVFLPNKHSYQ